MQDFINAFSKSAGQKQLTMNHEVTVMKQGISEILYMVFKEEQNNMDAYLLHVNELYKNLKDGYYDFTNDAGELVPRMLPNNQQHAVLVTFINKMKQHMGDDLRFDLSIAGLEKLAARREERKSRRAIMSGNQQQRHTFEGVKESKEYANSDAIKAGRIYDNLTKLQSGIRIIESKKDATVMDKIRLQGLKSSEQTTLERIKTLEGLRN